MANTTYRYLVYATLGLSLVVIVLGAYTRLTEAGLGCPDWPGCYGTLSVPQTPEQLAQAQLAYPDAPVEVEKAWNEMIHRYVAGTLGLLILALNIASWQQVSRPKKLPFCLLVVVCFQAALGMWTVTLNLMPVVVMGHLLGGVTIVSLLLLLTLRVRQQARQLQALLALPSDLLDTPAPALAPSDAQKLQHAFDELDFEMSPQQVIAVDAMERFNEKISHEQQLKDSDPADGQNCVMPTKWLITLAAFALITVVGQIMLGGWTAANYAAVVCTQLPLCEVDWLAQYDASAFAPIQPEHASYQFGVLDYAQRVTIHVTHRIGAVAVCGVVGLLVWQLSRYSQYRRLAVVITTVLAVQILLGITNVLAHLPLAVAVSHNLVGVILLLALVAANYRLVLDYRQASSASCPLSEKAWIAKERHHG
ncbi:COX15/CtaA family protein [Photobacterium kagoshimensis]|uniref:COX15/CtaA family protein n=1 Tax=Photobacterium kagoshimensis TaxID=2910242 RepID=UPI003D114655